MNRNVPARHDPRKHVKRITAFAVGLGLLCAAGIAAAIPAQPFADVQDGSPATDVTLTLVDGVAVGPDGDIYISHRSKNRIRRISADGTIITVAGTGTAGFSGDGGPAVAAELNFPAGLVLDEKGNLFIADRNNHRIRKVSPDGIITTIAGNGEADMMGDEGPALEASLNLPSDLALDDAGNLYISDRSNNRVRKVDADGRITTVAGLGPAEYGGDFGPAEDALLKYPFGICLDKKGNLYIADRGNNRIRKVTPSGGTITTVAGDGMHSFSGDYGPASRSSLAYPTDVVADGAGNLYIADRNNNRIRKVDPQGVITTFMGTGKPDFNGDREIAVETNLHLPFALALDEKRQRLIVVDRSHFRVRSVDLRKNSVRTIAGNGTSLFKGDGGPGRGATLNAPSGLVVDSKGTVYFAEKNHNRIRRIDKNGIITTFAGTGTLGNEGDGGPALEATLYLPSAMAIDGEDNIYFAGRSGNGWNVRRIDKNGTISHFAGNGLQGDSGDGGPAVDASFYSITDIATDREGNVYIADRTNFSIRKIDKNGIITKVFGKEDASDSEIHPNGLAVDDAGNIYLSDSGSSKIRRIGTDGKVETVAGSGAFTDTGDEGSALSAGIRSPGGLALSPDGELYILEETSSVIRKIGKDGTIARVAGTGVPGFSGDGGPALKAQIKSPFRMSFDAEGNLYFTDRDNNRIRKIDKQGVIHTVAGHGNFGWLQDGLEVRITVHNFP